MECFSGFWSRRLEEGRASPPWFIGGVEYLQISPPGALSDPEHTPAARGYRNGSYRRYLNNIERERLSDDLISEDQNMEDVRTLIKHKAERHRNYYKSLCVSLIANDESSRVDEQMAEPVPHESQTLKRASGDNAHQPPVASKSPGGKELPANEGPAKQRQRRTGVFQLDDPEGTIFKSVKVMREKYIAMLEQTSMNLKGIRVRVDAAQGLAKVEAGGVDDAFLAPPPSGYCSSSGTSDDERDKNCPHVQRCASSDSAVGLVPSDEELPKEGEINYVKSPYSPRSSIDHVNVPSKTLIEAQYVPYPIDRKFSDCGSEVVECDDKSDSRRQSCFTDDGEDPPPYRYFRTPSVVVSDYSDDVIGLTLEDIEYIQKHRRDPSSSPDSSLHSSCSNLNYCGSSISTLDADYILRASFRKASDCSTCSTYSGDDENDNNTLPVCNKKQTKYQDNILECALPPTAVMIMLFGYCWFGNELIEAGNGTNAAAYSSSWYLSEMRLQKYIILIIRQANEEMALTAAGLTKMNRNTLIQVFKFTMSMYTLFGSLTENTIEKM